MLFSLVWLALGLLVANGAGTLVLGRPMSERLRTLGDAGLFGLEAVWILAGVALVRRAWARGRGGSYRRVTVLEWIVAIGLVVSLSAFLVPAVLAYVR